MNFVDAIERGQPPLNPTRIVRASIGADNVPAMTAEELRAAAAQMAASSAGAAPTRTSASLGPPVPPPPAEPRALEPVQIGRASCRGRVERQVSGWRSQQ